MSKNPGRKNMRQSDFKVVARAARRTKPDYSRLMQATLDHHVELKTRTQGPPARPDKEADHGNS